MDRKISVLLLVASILGASESWNAWMGTPALAAKSATTSTASTTATKSTASNKSAKTTTKTLTIEDRQEQLMSNINQAQQSGELTAKEARGLRSDLGDVAHKKAKIKGKQTKLTADDQLKLESDLNEISVKITKLKLDKRVHPVTKDKSK